jgi:hypothetical protein
MWRPRCGAIVGSVFIAVALTGCGGGGTDAPGGRGQQSVQTSLRAQECPTAGKGAASDTLRCFGLPRRLAPAGADAVAWRVDRRTFVVTWRRAKESGYRVWRQRDGRWRRLFERPHLWSDGPTSVSLDDVNADGRRDVLIQGVSGSGVCGVRDVLAIGATRVTSLFHRNSECEQYSELRHGLLYYRKAIGPCPEASGERAHCYGGVRTTVRGWSGARVVTDRTVVRCLRRNLDPRRNCRRS